VWGLNQALITIASTNSNINPNPNLTNATFPPSYTFSPTLISALYPLPHPHLCMLAFYQRPILCTLAITGPQICRYLRECEVACLLFVLLCRWSQRKPESSMRPRWRHTQDSAWSPMPVLYLVMALATEVVWLELAVDLHEAVTVMNRLLRPNWWTVETRVQIIWYLTH